MLQLNICWLLTLNLNLCQRLCMVVRLSFSFILNFIFRKTDLKVSSFEIKNSIFINTLVSGLFMRKLSLCLRMVVP